jgi:uncharacterized protein YjbI with pentapeptide repeats
MTQANFWGAGRADPCSAGCDLHGADFRAAELLGVGFGEADLRGCDFSGANLEFAALAQADLAGAQFHGARYSTGTSWPEGFDPEAAGAVLVTDVY